MKNSRLIVLVTALALGGTTGVAHGDALGSGFTYQGQLKEAGAPASGDYDFRFQLYDAETGGLQIGNDYTVDDWPISNGLFTVPVDFGAAAFGSEARWLEVAVRSGVPGESYTVLSPRQPVTAAPVALYALNSPGGSGFWAASGNDIYNTNAGNVGIGTSSPAWELEVANLTPGDGAESGVTANDAGGAVAAYSSTLPPPFEHYAGRVSLFSNLETSGLDLRADALDGDIRFYAGGIAATNERMRITASGRVGIGTSDPTATLQVVRPVGSSANYAICGSDPEGAGVQGNSEQGYGVVGVSGGTTGIGVYGWATATSGTTTGVFGAAFSPDGYAGYFNGRGFFNGNVGIRVQEPQASLDALNWDGYPAVKGVSSGTGVYGLHDETTGTLPGVWGATNSTATSASGVRGFVNSTSPGSASTGVRGHNNSTTLNGYGVHGSHAGYGTGVFGESVGGIGVYAKSTSNWALYAETSGTTAARFVGNVEIVSPSSGQILIEFGEGLDYAEGFDVSDETRIGPGTVLVIDAENAGKLAMSSTPYDHKVAGIVAGANGLGSAVRLGAGQFDFDVALAGRVYCNVDAAYGAIRPGDLLTTSPTPGHAMRVTDHGKAQGAILGKAMQSLEHGEKGQILVLVTLQ
ncbi:MAG: hypothetical protein ABIG44_12715 [Planctomycetota bacterium]